ncbi:MAG: 2-oxoacid:acceptor oxidoreductase family protein, partial [Candidatus Odinarchaeota archaeon]|nr:2-oxoacid:acceptor oxidoreductase family protein [Candidatus Odinarchaeota archaeon]
MLEIRWHGRGGQGVVTSSELLAKATILEGKYAQHFPEFGPERRGAPVRAYTRIDDKPIEIHCGVYEPDIVVAIDPALSLSKDIVLAGAKKGTVVVLNVNKINDEFLKAAKEVGVEIYNCNAYGIALDVFGAPFYNTPMLGALVKATEIVKLDSVIEAVKGRFP